MNTLFEPSHNPAHLIEPPPSLPPTNVFLPDTTYDFRPPNFYPNLYTDPLYQPYVYPPPFVFNDPQNVTSNEKSHKWWSFHSIKEKLKSFFKKHHSKDETKNAMHVFDHQHQLWPGNMNSIENSKLNLN